MYISPFIENNVNFLLIDISYTSKHSFRSDSSGILTRREVNYVSFILVVMLVLVWSG